MTSSFNEILYDVRGGAAWIVLNRSREMNAMTALMLDEMARALEAASRAAA